MILHCVFLRFKASVTAVEKQEALEAIAALRDAIPGVLDIKFGPNISPEGLHAGFLDGFVVTVEDREARDAYLSHPDHMVAGDRLVSLTDGGLAGILVFDLEV